MLGILVGTDNGLLEVIPGAEPNVAFESGPITSIDYRDGVAIATGPDAGVWVHAGERWERIEPSLLLGGRGPAGLSVSFGF